ncbi:hypothetical protein ANCCAN_20581 [Ancylostoma caninum]|uniref:Uncharacterized protein n=1 Tax=Ancylostoma caninum TaxID=29170 RepID=A0A368FMX7_ANCCA|nr:hypothetical protein ANCCAN_20581 [Ancylostoma caninum]
MDRRQSRRRLSAVRFLYSADKYTFQIDVMTLLFYVTLLLIVLIVESATIGKKIKVPDSDRTLQEAAVVFSLPFLAEISTRMPFLP